ncbi:MAG TPA: DUF3857 domain-containing protein [Acidobacteriaceae bacterium]|nr:DUF3857 domain-containing protein [Acidobacteriaceae bacterium]
MRFHRSGLLCVSGVLALAAPLFAQTPSLASFAAEPYVLKTSSTAISMNADGTGTRVQTLVVAVQSEAALRQLSVVTIYFSSQTEHADFSYVRVVHPDGTTQQTPITDAIQQPAPVTREAPLYSDLQTLQVPVKSLRVGDTLEWQAHFTEFRAQAPGQFWSSEFFASGPVILDQSYELRVPSTVHLTVWTNPRAKANFSESEAGGQHIYRWQHSDLHPTIGTQAEAAKKAENERLRTSEEETDALKGALPSFAWSTFPSWAAVGAWYAALAADRTTPDDAIKAKVAELTAGKSTDLEKAQAIYNFVATRIRYIGVDFGVGRYQPHTAAEVFANQFGDCKDKHTLLASMLSVAGIHADPVLIGAGIRFNSVVPSPASFNHLITRATLGGKDIWLDSTAESGVWAALLKPIRDQDVLVVPSSTPAIVAHTPAELPFAQSSSSKVVGSLDTSLTSESTITFTFHNDDELYLRAALRSVSPADYGEFIERMMSGMGYGGTTSEPQIEHLEDPAQPLQLALHYHRVQNKDWGENRITAVFQPVVLPYFTADDPPNSTIQLGSVRTEDSSVEMHLPNGWSAELPEPVHAHAPFATCDVTYSLKDHKLFAERRLAILQPTVTIKDFKKYMSWYDDAGVSGTPYIQLNPPPKAVTSAVLPEPKAPDAASTAPRPSDPKAAELVAQAAQSARSMDLNNARKLLDQAAAINPTEPKLWVGYGIVAELLGMRHQELEDVQRELTYHPDEAPVYAYLAQLQLAGNDSASALATLRTWVKLAPDTPQAATALARELQTLKLPDQALDAANTAITHLKSGEADLTTLRLIAARAQLDLGKSKEAAEAAAPLLQTATEPDQVHQIDDILARSNTHLAEAAEAESRLIAASEAATQNWSSSTDDLQSLMQQQAKLADQWQTLALILTHQDKYTQALGYAKASLYATASPDAHDILASITRSLHNSTASAELHAEPQQLRTFPLGPAKGRHGVASMTLLLVDGKVLDSTPDKRDAGSAPPLPSAPELIQTADLRALFPPASKVHLVRPGFVNCHGTICELVLAPLPAPR